MFIGSSSELSAYIITKIFTSTLPFAYISYYYRPFGFISLRLSILISSFKTSTWWMLYYFSLIDHIHVKPMKSPRVTFTFDILTAELIVVYNDLIITILYWNESDNKLSLQTMDYMVDLNDGWCINLVEFSVRHKESILIFMLSI